jgi:hypothetical protein
MKKFSLNCISENDAKGKWVFEPSKNGMSVYDADEQKVCWFPHSEANDRFTLPSFWRSVRNIGFQIPNGMAVEFEPDRRSVEKVKDYLEEAIASGGIEAVDRLRTRGWTHLLVGLGLIVFGFLAFGGVYVVLEVTSRLVGYVCVGMAFVGIGEAAWGASALVRAGRVRGRLRSDED